MSENQMLAHVESIPSLIREAFPTMDREAVRIAELIADWPLECVYLYGSGDSWAAALGATGAFMELCGLPAYALPSMQASRYAPGYCMPAPGKVLAVGVSSSGRVRRPLEATQSLSKAGYHPILVTASPDSPGGEAAWQVFHSPLPPFDRSPGVRNYVVAQLALFLLAIRLAEKRGRLDQARAEALVRELSQTDALLERTLEDNREKLRTFGELCAREERVEFLASGPCKAAADFGMAKVYEATGYTALSPELEEFAHMNFFALRPHKIPTVLICSGGARCLKRVQEMEESTRHQGRPYIVITDGDAFQAPASQVLRVPQAQSEMFAPLAFSFLTACLTAYMPLEPGDRYMHGHEGPFLEEGFPTIMNSELVL